MKKFLFSSFIILISGFCVVYKNHFGTAVLDAPVVINKTTLPMTNEVASVGQLVAGSLYRDGRYMGVSSGAYYGDVQVGVTVAQGKIIEVDLLQYPQEQQNSVRLNQDAIPRLQSEVIVAQNSDVDAVTGASLTSAAFLYSLSSALTEARS